MNAETIEELKAMCLRLREIFPQYDPTLDCYKSSDYMQVHLHRIPNYATATAIAQSIGMGEREKQMHDPKEPWGVLRGRVNGLTINLYFKGLAPSCRVEKVVERIPRVDTKVTEEYVEVETVKIVCGEPAEVS